VSEPGQRRVEVAPDRLEQVVAEGPVQPREQRLVEPGPVVQPGRVRQAVLRPAADVIRQYVGERLPDDPLLLAVADLERRRNPHGQLDHGRVEERHPHLDALAHAGAVDPLQLGPAQVADLVQEQPRNLAGGHVMRRRVACQTFRESPVGAAKWRPQKDNCVHPDLFGPAARRK
jgi:hypothetical protein